MWAQHNLCGDCSTNSEHYRIKLEYLFKEKVYTYYTRNNEQNATPTRYNSNRTAESKRNEEREKIKVKRNKHIFIDLDKKIC
mgnify:CR=1 FL=1